MDGTFCHDPLFFAPNNRRTLLNPKHILWEKSPYVVYYFYIPFVEEEEAPQLQPNASKRERKEKTKTTKVLP